MGGGGGKRLFPTGIRQNWLLVQDHCPWKGDASYYSVHADGKELGNAAWYYAQTKDKAEHIRNHVAFCESGMVLLVPAGSWPSIAGEEAGSGGT